MEIKLLEWDSSFFGLKIGQANSGDATFERYENLLAAKRNLGYDIIYWFADRYAEVNFPVSEAGILTPIDVKLTYSKTALKRESDLRPALGQYKGPLTGKLVDLAIESGHKSRFRKDPRLSGRFVDMYTTWISKSVSGELSDAVFVSESQNDINGFVTIRKVGLACSIGLIAVDREARGQGIGGALLDAAENWCVNEGGIGMTVATQQENQSACRLYERHGYGRLSAKYIFHI